MTIIICELNLRFPLIGFWFLWCNCVCLSYIRVLQTKDQALVALVEDLQNGPKCMWVKYGIFSLFGFSSFDLTLVDSNVILISLETFSNHWNHFKWSCSRICTIGKNTWEGTCQFFLFLEGVPLALLEQGWGSI